MDEAEKDCDEAIRIKPDFLKGYFRKGVICKHRSQWKEALTQFRRVLDLDPQNKDAKKEITQVEDQIKKLKKNADSAQTSSSIRKIIPIQIPSNLPRNSSEFELTWRDLGDSDSTKDDLRYQYLIKMGPELFGSLNSDLEPDLFSEILDALMSGLNLCDNLSGIRADILERITRCRRFDIISQFLNSDDQNRELSFSEDDNN